MPNKISAGTPVKTNVRCQVLRSGSEPARDTDGEVIGVIPSGKISFFDTSPLSGDNWYRLRVENLDTGKVAYSLPMKAQAKSSRGTGWDTGPDKSQRVANYCGVVDVTDTPIGTRLGMNVVNVTPTDDLLTARKYIDEGKVKYTGWGMFRSWSKTPANVTTPAGIMPLIRDAFVNGADPFHPSINSPNIDYVEEAKGVKYRIRAPRGFDADWDGVYEIGKPNAHMFGSELQRLFQNIKEDLIPSYYDYGTGKTTYGVASSIPLNDPYYIIAEMIGGEIMAINSYGILAKVADLPAYAPIYFSPVIEIIG